MLLYTFHNNRITRLKTLLHCYPFTSLYCGSDRLSTIQCFPDSSHSQTPTFENENKKNKNKNRWQRKDNIPALPIAEQKLQRYFEGYLEFFAVCQYLFIYLFTRSFIPSFLAEPLMKLCGTLIRKRFHKLSRQVTKNTST
jgi:hypothetical protein